MKKFSVFYPHLLAILGFVIVALVYFYPVLQGKQLYQSDIAQYTGMAKEQNDFRKDEGKEPYWTNAAFGGMPTYQLGANYPYNYIKKIDNIIRFLPRPADYLFLYFAGFYVLLLVLKIDPLKAFFGALAFGFSTYLIIILGVGHNAKAHAIAYMPMVVAGALLVFRKKYLWGGLLTVFAAALEINANHFQMTYYLFFLLLVIGVFYAYPFIRDKQFVELGKVALTFLIAGIFALGVNAPNLLATAEYTNFSNRGKSELTFNPDGSRNQTTASMDYDYITEYSYGLLESLNLFAPRLFGGSNTEKLGEDSAVHEFILGQGATGEEAAQFTQSYGLTYWGDQPIVAAPAYVGAIVFFLAVLAFFTDKRKLKYAFLSGILLSLWLSWGKNFPVLTHFFIDYVPLYDKFRAVSSIQVILELCMPALAIMGLYSFFNLEKEKQWPAIWKSFAISGGLLVLLLLAKGLFSFSSAIDEQLRQAFAQMGPTFSDEFLIALKADRRAMYTSDLIRSLVFVTLVALLLFLYTKEKLSQFAAVTVIGLLMVFDLVSVDKKYVGNDGFVSAREVREPFHETQADQRILEDKGIYRVYDLQGRLQGRASYFHKAVGGYSAVRPRRYDQLFEYVIDRQLDSLSQMIDPVSMSLKRSVPALNALNVKYLIVSAGEQEVPVTNPYANGEAWFVDRVRVVHSADEEIKAMATFDAKREAIIGKDFEKETTAGTAPDTTASIKVDVYKPNYIKYTAQHALGGIAVFSEVYYPKGWTATIDGKETPIFRSDYVLRAIRIPAGQHTVEFRFEPQVVKTGGAIALVSFIGVLLLLAGGLWYERKKVQSAVGNAK